MHRFCLFLFRISSFCRSFNCLECWNLSTYWFHGLPRQCHSNWFVCTASGSVFFLFHFFFLGRIEATGGDCRWRSRYCHRSDAQRYGFVDARRSFGFNRHVCAGQVCHCACDQSHSVCALFWSHSPLLLCATDHPTDLVTLLVLNSFFFFQKQIFLAVLNTGSVAGVVSMFVEDVHMFVGYADGFIRLWTQVAAL